MPETPCVNYPRPGGPAAGKIEGPPPPDFLEDFPPGPLDLYRKNASFHWRNMAVLMEDESILRFKFKVWKIMEQDPEFAHTFTEPTLHEV